MPATSAMPAATPSSRPGRTRRLRRRSRGGEGAGVCRRAGWDADAGSVAAARLAAEFGRGEGTFVVTVGGGVGDPIDSPSGLDVDVEVAGGSDVGREVGDSGRYGEAEGGCGSSMVEGDLDGGWVVFIGPYPVGVDIHEVEVAIEAHPGRLISHPRLDQAVAVGQDRLQGVQQVERKRLAASGLLRASAEFI